MAKPFTYDFVIPHDEARSVRYREAAHGVCSGCLDQKDDGTCALRPVCSIQKYLPIVVEVSGRVQSKSMEDYEKEIDIKLKPHGTSLEQLNASKTPGDDALPSHLYRLLEVIDEVRRS